MKFKIRMEDSPLYIFSSEKLFTLSFNMLSFSTVKNTGSELAMFPESSVI